MFLLKGLDTAFIRKGSVLAIRTGTTFTRMESVLSVHLLGREVSLLLEPDTTFIRMGSVFAPRASGLGLCPWASNLGQVLIDPPSLCKQVFSRLTIYKKGVKVFCHTAYPEQQESGPVQSVSSLQVPCRSEGQGAMAGVR